VKQTKIFTSADRKKFKEKILDKVSPSFCLAKWYEATMWLYMGETASCHHNPTHKIKLDPNDLSSLHNTDVKLHERNRMLRGEQPRGCAYCWNAEKYSQISDRVLKSYSYEWDLITKDIPKSVTPLLLEVAFSRTCNLACSYCGPVFSSSWAKDIKNNGSYNLITTSKYNHDVKEKILEEDTNKYIDAFLEWWPELSKTLQIIRFTGGEPLLHKKFWEFLDLLDDSFHGVLYVNSNLIHHKGQVEKFIEKTKFLWEQEKVEIHTSCESNLKQAEFTRDGFDGVLWYQNVETILNDSKIKLTITTAVNNISVWSYIDYLRMVNSLREKYGSDRIQMNANRVLHPEIHQIQLIPINYRLELANEIENEMPKLKNLQDTHSEMQSKNQKKFLKTSKWDKTLYSKKDIEKDMIKFYDEFKKRRNKTEEYLDARFLKWIADVR